MIAPTRFLLRHDSRVLATALDVDPLPHRKIGSHRLSDLHQHPDAEAHDDLLTGDWLVVLLLDFIADNRAADRSSHHGDVATGAASDQAADPESGKAPNDGAEALVMIGGNLRGRNLLDDSALNLDSTGLWPGRCTR